MPSLSGILGYLSFGYITWWRHQMETFSALLALFAGNSPVTVEFSAQRPVTRRFDVFFGLCPNKRLSKQSWGWWFETLSRPLWRLNIRLSKQSRIHWEWPHFSYCKFSRICLKIFLIFGYQHVMKFCHINSLWPSDAVWRQRSGSTFAQVMACCLTAPSHYLYQWWLIISEVQRHSY